MVKKLSTLTAALLVVVLFLCGVCGGADTRVFDYAELFSSSEEQTIQSEVDRLRKKFDIDIVILTSYDVEYSEDDNVAEKNSVAYADDFYDRNGFGTGSDNSGFVFFIDMSNRMPTISTCGSVIDIVTDSRLEALFDSCSSSLRYGDYSQAVLNVLEQLEVFLKKGVPEGQYRYDAETGQIITTGHLRLEGDEVAVAVMAALLAAIIPVISVSAKYKLKGSTYSYNRARNATLTMTDGSDVYVTSHVARTPRSTGGGGGGGGGFGGGGGSSVHSSGGGVSHGGGSGGRF